MNISFRLFSLGVFLLILLIPRTQAQGFSDVSDNDPFAESIFYLQSQGYVQGYPDGTYASDLKINRAEFTKIVLEFLLKYFGGVPEGDGKSCFPDVPGDAWFAKYVCYAKSHGIIAGYPDGTFRPTDNISIVEAAKIIVVGRGYRIDPTQQPWFKPYIDGLVRRHAIPLSIQGYTDLITRGEMAEILFRILVIVDFGMPSHTFETLGMEGTQRGVNFDFGEVEISLSYPSEYPNNSMVHVMDSVDVSRITNFRCDDETNSGCAPDQGELTIDLMDLSKAPEVDDPGFFGAEITYTGTIERGVFEFHTGTVVSGDQTMMVYYLEDLPFAIGLRHNLGLTDAEVQEQLMDPILRSFRIKAALDPKDVEASFPEPDSGLFSGKPPIDVVKDYVNSTLATLPTSHYDPEHAKTLLTADLRAQWAADEDFIPHSYGIQDGPTEAQFTVISEGETTAQIELYATYDGHGPYYWTFTLEKQPDDKWLISSYTSLPTGF